MSRWAGVAIAGLILIYIGACNKPSSGSATPGGVTASAPGAGTAPAPADTAPKTDQQAIQEAIRQHLASNSSINMAAMDMSVDQVSVTGDQAQASAEFRLKQGGATMQMTYFLIRHAGGWLVTKSQPGGGQFAHPPLDQAHSGAARAPGASNMPDVSDFLKNAPAAKSSGSAKSKEPNTAPPNSP